MAKTSPTQRSLAICRKAGWVVQVVERWNAFAKVRQDLFGFIDLVALDGERVVGVQTTSASNVSARRKKILESDLARLWLRSGGRILIHGWKRSAKTKKWECREIEITIVEMGEA